MDLQALVDTHDEPFMVIDKNYCIKAANKAFEETFSFSRTDVNIKHCYEVTHIKDVPCHFDDEYCPHLSVFKLGESSTCEHTLYDKEGRLHRMLIKFYPFNSQDNGIFIGISIRSFAHQTLGEKKERVPLVGSSPAFQQCLGKLQVAAQAEMPVLLVGETGTGKQLAAEFIHRSSGRRDHPFVTVDCALLTEKLFESELLGVEKESSERAGLIELADGGTLFLDEISETPPSIQSKLMRILETGEFRPLGSTRMRKADVRILCSTNRNLFESMKRGDFRKDLYYRIAAMTIAMPPLRDRLTDIPAISEELLLQISRKTRISYRLTREALQMLMNYDYPGNVRELRNILANAAAQAFEGVIHTVTISGPETHELEALEPPRPPASLEEPTSLDDAEAHHIVETLRKTGGSRRDAARLLGISERTLYRKMSRYSIK